MKRFLSTCVALAALLPATGAAAVEISPRPQMRPAELNVSMEVRPVSGDAFESWLAGYRERAMSRGISVETLDRALAGVRFDESIISKDRNQAEFTKMIWTYLDTAVSEARVAAGRKAVAQHRDLLEGIEASYGVPAGIVAAIWGLESAYGAVRGNNYTIEALATLAADERRGPFFEHQLEAALKIIEAGDVTPDRMVGSWAGAMGHTQFMPISYLIHAVDHDGDGRRDIWGDDPADALASTAAFLNKAGWIEGLPWGLEVTLPDDFDHALAGHPTKKMPSEWAALGVTDTSGQPVPDHGRASVLLPGGWQGAAFMIFDNFVVLERYNTADAYVIAVGHLGDRIMGGPALVHDWPRRHRALVRDERLELQQRLTEAGYTTQGIDGRIGPNTIAGMRAWQKSRGEVPDGFPTMDALEALRMEGP